MATLAADIIQLAFKPIEFNTIQINQIRKGDLIINLIINLIKVATLSAGITQVPSNAIEFNVIQIN